MNDWFKLQKYIKIVYDRHLKPFLNVNVPRNDYKCAMICGDTFLATV